MKNLFTWSALMIAAMLICGGLLVWFVASDSNEATVYT